MAEIEVYAVATWLYRFRSLRRPGAPDIEAADPRKLEEELTAIEQQFLWCSNFEAMNDPMEGFYRLPAKRRSRDEGRFDVMVWNEKSSLGIASFSETWDNELMWAHYADGFRGLCVTFKVAPLLEGLGEGCGLTRVAYGDRPYYLNVRLRRESELRARAALSTKTQRWAYEREWRVIASQSGPAQYGEGVVATVMLGHRMAENDRTYIRGRLEEAGITVKQTRIDGYSIKRA